MKIYLKVDNLEILRIKKGYTKEGLAKEFGVGRTAYEKWYKGGPIRPTNAKKATEALGVTFDEIFEIREKGE